MNLVSYASIYAGGPGSGRHTGWGYTTKPVEPNSWSIANGDTKNKPERHEVSYQGTPIGHVERTSETITRPSGRMADKVGFRAGWSATTLGGKETTPDYNRPKTKDAAMDTLVDHHQRRTLGNVLGRPLGI